MRVTSPLGTRLLEPIGFAFGAVADLRRRWYATHPSLVRRLLRPVVSVGNLSVGGSGKTPLVALVATMLRDEGERPAVLSRGYARTRHVDGVVVVRDTEQVRAGLDSAGDEPFMLARSLDGVAVLVSPDRHLSGTLAEARLGCTVHVLDDGFQHVRLWRDVDVLIASRSDLQNERVMPAGRLRERPVAARHADALIVTDVDPVEATSLGAAAGVRVAFAMRRTLGQPAGPHGESLAIDRSSPVVAVAGTARPERFFDDLAGAGWTVAAAVAVGDHHVYTPRDLDRISEAAVTTQAGAVLTTEKDIVRWPATYSLPVPLAAVPLAVTVEPAGDFRSWLLGRVAQAHDSSRDRTDRA